MLCGRRLIISHELVYMMTCVTSAKCKILFSGPLVQDVWETRVHWPLSIYNPTPPPTPPPPSLTTHGVVSSLPTQYPTMACEEAENEQFTAHLPRRVYHLIFRLLLTQQLTGKDERLDRALTMTWPRLIVVGITTPTTPSPRLEKKYTIYILYIIPQSSCHLLL